MTSDPIGGIFTLNGRAAYPTAGTKRRGAWTQSRPPWARAKSTCRPRPQHPWSTRRDDAADRFVACSEVASAHAPPRPWTMHLLWPRGS